MRSVGIKVLKNKLSEYVRLAANGETVLVTDRDRVWPNSCRRPLSIAAKQAEAKWAELFRLGTITQDAPSTPRRCAKGRDDVASQRLVISFKT